MNPMFDPYHQWLGISPKDQPPNHYRLLGIDLFESDPDVISNAADQRMAHVRSFQSGKHAADSQKLLNEIAAARVCLLSPEKKAAYDELLRRATSTTVAPDLAAPASTERELENLFQPGSIEPNQKVRAENRLGIPGVIIGIIVAGAVVLGLLAVVLSSDKPPREEPAVAQRTAGTSTKKELDRPIKRDSAAPPKATSPAPSPDAKPAPSPAPKSQPATPPGRSDRPTSVPLPDPLPPEPPIEPKTEDRQTAPKVPKEPTTEEPPVPGEAGESEKEALGFPSIAGEWREGAAKVVITQQDDRFDVVCTYRDPKGQEIRWEMQGQITKDGRLQGNLVHVRGNEDHPGFRQVRTGVLGPDGAVRGRASWTGGGHDFVWTREEPRLSDDAKAAVLEKAKRATKRPTKASGGFPLIAGTWQESPAVQITITQRGGRFQATTAYRGAQGQEIRWQMDGTITRDGRFRGELVHTKGGTGAGVRQLRVGNLGPDGVLHLHASWPGGQADMNWTPVKPAEASDR